jgi:phosphoserine phosphatase RsbU/P
MSRPQVTIGFFVDTLSQEYQQRVFAGLHAEASRLNISVVCFIGGPLNPAGVESHQNTIYNRASATHLDGLVIAAGTLGNQVGAQALTSFVESFDPLPTCSVGIELPNTPSVSIDNHTGMREALLHLLEEGGRRRIAFIRGPEGNREAEERFSAYRNVLLSHGLSVNQDLVTSGDFEAASGSAAIRTLIDERHVAFDAVVAASDLMALGALNALLERGVSVPDKVAVVGFDDIEAARFATAPLTTVRQPLSDLGKRALENVVNQIFQTGDVGNVVLPARLVKRESSRAALPQESLAPHPLPQTSLSDTHLLEEGYRAIRDRLHPSLQALAPHLNPNSGWPEQLCGAFVAEVCGRRRGLLKRLTFLETLEPMLLVGPTSQTDSAQFHEVVSVMRRELLPHLRNSSELRETAETLWNRARILIGSINERLQVQHRLQESHWRKAIRTLGGELLRAETWEALSSAIARGLPRLGIPSCAVCVLEGNRTELRVAIDDGMRLTTPAEHVGSSELLPMGVLSTSRRRTLLVHSLFRSSGPLGHVVFELGPLDPEAYALLRDYIHGVTNGLRRV